MIQTGFETRVKVQQIIENQLPEFIIDENPKAAEFLKQYYISQEYQGGTVDIVENLDQYLKLDNLTPEIVTGSTVLINSIDSSSGIVTVTSTKGFPQKYGLFKIDDEIITYTGITTNTFLGCIRGFSGITTYHQISDYNELEFSTSKASSHDSNSTVQNLSSLFLKEFYKKLKYSLTPGLEDVDFIPDLNVGNFIKESRSFYQSKGTNESFRILFNVLYGITPTIVNLENFIIKPSSAEYVRRKNVVAEVISGDPYKLVGQSIRKSSDPNTYASVSSVEIITVEDKSYYQLSLFVGYDESADIQGSFNIQGKTIVVENVSIGSSIITVDSTIGFNQTGTLICGNNIIDYTDKTINQFLGCSGIIYPISTADSVRTDEIVYGYEDGDLTKKVELRFTGILSDFIPLSEIFTANEGDEIYVKNIGEIIKNPETNKTYKEIFANSWIYNTSCRYQIDYISGSSLVLMSSIDKSSIKVGDSVEILLRDTQTVVSSPTTIPYVQSIDLSRNQINLTNLINFNYNPTLSYDVRRKLNKSQSSATALKYGNNNLTSDVQNVYNGNDGYMYVASNSLPSYKISKNIFKYSIKGAVPPKIQGFDNITQKYSIISFDNDISFITGDEIYYIPESTEIPGLSEGIYYVEVISSNKIRLYASRSFIGSTYDSTSLDRPYVEFFALNSTESHYFILNDQKNEFISSNKILKKFTLSPNTSNGSKELTQPGTTGMLINGVEITNYKSTDKVFYGPLESIEVLNGGNNYDVINEPKIVVTSESGNGALIQPIIRGSVQKVFVDPQNFDINSVLSVSISGGNGYGASFETFIEKRSRELAFDGRLIDNFGGIDANNETITFTYEHNLRSGDILIYNSNGNSPIGIGTFYGLNTDQGTTLLNGSSYYCSVVNSNTIQIYNNISDYNLGINTVGFTTTNTTGIHKFVTVSSEKTLQEIKVINSGEGYENRKLIVKPTGISTVYDTINFENHGFNDGDLIVYNYDNQPIIGLSSSIQYKILKVDNNSFKLCNAGFAGTITSYYDRKDYINLKSSGSGYQYFSYPPISLTINYTAVGLGTTVQSIKSIEATPVIRGKIVGAYLYETGTDYGSTILNHHKKPIITIKTGKNAQITPVVDNGEIKDVFVQYGGEEYYSTPDLIVRGEGTGAELRPVIVDGKINNVIIVNSGVGYAQSTTSVVVVSPSGNNAVIDCNVRSLTVNNNFKYGDEIIINNNEGALKYSISGYNSTIKSYFIDPDPNTGHSPIIGWAYDGNPIYGPYGYSDPNDIESGIKNLTSGYSLTSAYNRPTEFGLGFFVEDYQYTNIGDLDENNGRYCITPDFKNGVYAYFATRNSSNTLFPYFIGNSYRSNYIDDNLIIDQSFDFNNSNLIRNTLPYKVIDDYAKNDFIIESNKLVNQKSIVESVYKSGIDSFDIITSGSGYRINDSIEFDNTETGGGGLNAAVSSITGVGITSILTSIDTYQNSIVSWKDSNTIEITVNSNNSLNSGDNVVISGLTTSLSQINNLVKLETDYYQSSVSQNIPENYTVGIVTDIYVTQIPDKVSIGSSIKIESEFLTLLNVFPYEKIIRVKRNIGSAHTESTLINFIPNTFTFKVNSDYFESQPNNKVFFNPSESIGLGRSVGVSTARVFSLGISTLGVSTYVRYIPTQSIYIENHPFSDNQKVTLTIPNSSYPISVSTSTSGSTFNIPSINNSQTVYVTNKSNNTIGFKTTLSSSELFFVGFGTNSYEYSLESNFNQVLSKVEKIKSIVSVSTYHGLNEGDPIKLTVNPNLSVGIGTSSSIYVKYDTINQKLLINPLGFSSTGINTVSSTIKINNHNLNTGDKILYTSSDKVASGLNTGSYFVYKIDDDNIKLSQTYIDCKIDPPSVVSIASTGGKYQNISLINPSITCIKNNNLTFNLSDSSLIGYKFKIFYDQEFKNEFISDGSTNTFSISGIGTVGISTNASITINYSDNLPKNLYYSLEKSGSLISVDKEVINYSNISLNNSVYTGSYNIFDTTPTSFSICLSKKPEKSYYFSQDCDILKYSTTSESTKGGIDNIKILSSGSNYKKIPVFSRVNSIEGSGAYIVAKSNKIGKVKDVRILNSGFEYSSDKTLKPSSFIPPVITIESSYKISSVDVIYGGSGYNFAPTLQLIDSTTRNPINSGSLIPVLSGNTITSVNILSVPTGIPAGNLEIISTNNSNGCSINSIETSGTGIVTCYLSTPLLGFSTSPFSVGDKVYVEGIENYSDGTGYNSENYGYNFFEVTKFENITPLAKLEYDISALTANAGIAKTYQNSLPTIVKSTDYPIFNVNKSFSEFYKGEKVLVYLNNEFVETDLSIVSYEKSIIRIYGTYDLKIGNIIKGSISASIATINQIQINEGEFKTDYYIEKTIGWTDNVGKLNEDYQVIEDNDYYQNLSYTIKSPLEYETLTTPVNRLLHTVGLKNFADTGITSTSNSGIQTSVDSTIQIFNALSESRVDTINDYDLAIDIDSSASKTKFVRFANKKLASYIKCISNRVLLIDDISPKFSNSLSENNNQNNLIEISENDKYNRYLIQISDTEKLQYQLSEVVILNNNLELYTVEKSFVSNDSELSKIASIEGYTDESNLKYLRFTPKDIYNKDYNIKILSNTFINDLPGIGTQSLGVVNITSVNKNASSGITTTIVSFASTIINSLYCNLHVNDTINNDSNYVEIYLSHDGTNTYISEYYFDSHFQTSSFNHIGEFKASLSGGILYLNFTNNSTNPTVIRSRIVGFGSSTLGIGTYRYNVNNQIEGTEKTALYQSNYSNSSGISTVLSLPKDKFSGIKSIIRIGLGNTSALHQVLLLNDNNNLYTTQYPFLSIGSTSGIGSFGAEYSGSNVILKFYPDTSIVGNIDITSYNEELYSDYDFINIPKTLDYGTITESLNVFEYGGLNGNIINKKDFDLNYNNYPIFKKTFDPTDNSTLDLNTGIFTIKNHFFSTGEELIYNPNSTLIGVGNSPLGIGSTANYAGIVTDLLPSKVYAIKLTNDTFNLSTRQDYANAGIYVTFTSYGSGNSHELEMAKKLEKTVICIDDLTQYPLAYTTINYKLGNNGPLLSDSSTIFSISGITSIRLNDILKIDDEYMNIVNVGFGTTNVGPISGIGTIGLVEVDRGYVGSLATTHVDSGITTVKIYRGSYNISGNKIYFTDPPLGNSRLNTDDSNLEYPKSLFQGRVYLRSNYASNVIYDNISDKFTGIGRTYTLTVDGNSAVGLGTSGGNGVVFINSIFQKPTTSNNSGNNFNIVENSGISSIVFSGISSSSYIVISPDDVNQNSLPRGGIIVSLGSTGGLGYAPLVGASVTAVVGAGGSIVSVGLGTTDILGSGYYGLVSIGITDSTGSNASISASVGAGGTLSFEVLNGGSGYSNPTIKIPSPSYQNLPLVGVSRIGIGSTTESGVGLLINVEVSASSTTGIGSTLFEVSSFKVQRSGYGYRPGDVITPVGLVTAQNLSSPISQFNLNILGTYTDSFAAWQFGELDYIDSIKNLQDGNRVAFPLYYNSSLLSFEIDVNDPYSSEIDLSSVLIIFINGILQNPKESYIFNGGSSFTFVDPPKSEDDIAIFFYRGTKNVDSQLISINETVKSGDIIQLRKNNSITSTIDQNPRTVFSISKSNSLETYLYTEQGIDDVNEKPLSWTKQKIDNQINGEISYKSRDSIESEVYPTAKIIKDFSTKDTEIFVDDAYFFNYEGNLASTTIDPFNALIVSGNDPISAALTATVSIAGTISKLTLNNPGIGYTGSSVIIKISPPRQIGVGIGTTAIAVATVVNGSLTTSITITNPGYGYSISYQPQVFVPTPTTKYEKITGITNVQGFSGIITGIGTTAGTLGNPLAIQFYLNTKSPGNFLSGISSGYPILIYDTVVGSGVTSIDKNNNDVVGIGTTCLDNIYKIHSFTPITSSNAFIVCNVESNTTITGIVTDGKISIGNTISLGKFSWGRLSGFTRSSSPISIGVSNYIVDVGLSTFPTMQRRSYGLRNTGGLEKNI